MGELRFVSYRIKHEGETEFRDEFLPFDPDAPCFICELPVETASVGGTAICPACDSGRFRDGTPHRSWEYRRIDPKRDAGSQDRKRFLQEAFKAWGRV